MRQIKGIKVSAICEGLVVSTCEILTNKTELYWDTKPNSAPLFMVKGLNILGVKRIVTGVVGETSQLGVLYWLNRVVAALKKAFMGKWQSRGCGTYV